eukprot:2840848-Rhodomonas_salina.2
MEECGRVWREREREEAARGRERALPGEIRFNLLMGELRCRKLTLHVLLQRLRRAPVVCRCM